MKASPVDRRLGRWGAWGLGACSAATLAALLVGCGGAPEITVDEQPVGGSAPTVPVGASSDGPPQVVSLDPPQGATDVDPLRTTLSVTFDRPMDRQGWSWVQEDPASSPEFLEGVSFDAAGRTNTVEVRLAPGRSYVVWVNSAEYSYFRDLAGRSATPLRWTFSTAGGAPAAGAAPPMLSSRSRTGPQVVALEPANGAVDVDPALDTLRVTFDRPMAGGWSWVRDATGLFPERRGEAFFEPDGRSNVLPVTLAPNTTYVVWLNSAEFQYFQSREGQTLSPVRWEFRTGAVR